MCNAPYAGSHPPPASAVSRANDVMAARTAQMAPDRCSTAATQAGSRGKVKSEKLSVDHYAQRVGPYPTPQQYMLNKRAKYAGTAAPVAAEVRCIVVLTSPNNYCHTLFYGEFLPLPMRLCNARRKLICLFVCLLKTLRKTPQWIFMQ